MTDAIRKLAERVLEDVPAGTVLVTDPAKWFDPPNLDADFPSYVLGWYGALRMVVETSTQSLTDNERAVIDKVGDLAADFMDIVGDGPTSAADWNEILPHLHALQQAVMAQAAARTHPTKYRTMGGEL